MDARYRSLDGDPRAWKSGDASGPKAKTHQGMVYAIQSPFTGELHYPPAGKCWRPEQREVLQWLQGWGCRYELRDIGDAQTRAAVIGVPPAQVPVVKALVVKGVLPEARKVAARVLERTSCAIPR